jgi:class 3 adenylate cyclase/tetratricopeptide (TPR) repeat protein
MTVCPACGHENPEEARFCSSCGTALTVAAPARETRKTVTIVFCDVTGSTALGEHLDPESLRRVMARYFDEMQAVVERHGGTVEKFIGDAVMAVFGVPVLHEDDALRGVRAAAEMRERLEALNEDLDRDWGVRIQMRTGVNTGEVVAGDASGGQRFATGDAVNVAKRFEEAASAGEILLGEPTYRLVRDAVGVEEMPALELKGKQEPTPAYRLLSVELRAEGRARRLDSPMVGREREQRLLLQAHERVVGDRACHLFTVLGAAGVGKSRLVAEFLEAVSNEATIVRGRCLPYGEGITFWPLLEVVRQLFGEDVPATIAGRLAGDESAGPTEETFWAVRKLFEEQARERPLVLVFDDMQWAEPTFLDLIEHVADLSRDAPILLLCLARPDLLDVRPGWAGGKFNATSVLLEPLSDEDATELIGNLLGRAELDAEVRMRVTDAAEGNPLFVEEMLGMLIDDGLLLRNNGSWVATGDLGSVSVPPTIQALLAARLERLEQAERAVVERASVEGKVFHRGAVAELTPTEIRSDVGGHLQTLIRKELVRPDQAQFTGEDAFRFRHMLIRDAAYEAMPKELRAALHERFAEWLERTAGDRIAEYEEILGYHLEQAYRYRVELAPPDDQARSLAAAAAERLGTAGERAHSRSDAPAAASLLGRALDLLPPESPSRPRLLCDLGLALSDQGEFGRAEAALTEAIGAADPQNEPALAQVATLRSIWVRLVTGTAHMQESYVEVKSLTRALEELGDDGALAEAYHLLGALHTWRGRCLEGEEACRRSAALALRSGNHRVASRSLTWIAIVAFWGPRPIQDALDLCARAVADGQGSRYVEGYASVVAGALHAMAGRWDEGQALIANGRGLLGELGQRVSLAAISMTYSETCLLAGRIDEAERDLQEAYAVLHELGEKAYLSTITALLALSACALERYGEAESHVAEARELGAPDDLTTQLYARCAEAEILASRGEIDQALLVAQAAQDLIGSTDYLTDRGSALCTRAKVEKAAGNLAAAREALAQAVALFEQKGSMSAVANTRKLMAEL